MRKVISFIWFLAACLVFSGIFISIPKLAAAQEEEKITMPLDLDGTRWATELTLLEGKGKKPASEDVLVFENKKFYSETFKKKGFEPTNYSASLNADGTTKFGTMQLKGGDRIYWEGIVKDGVVSGTIFVYSDKAKGVKEEYYFKSTLSDGTLGKRVKKGKMATKVNLPPKPSLKSEPDDSSGVGEGTDQPVEQEAESAEIQGNK